MIGWLTSNLAIKVLVGSAAVVGVVGVYSQPPPANKPCTLSESDPMHSAVYSCPTGLNTVALFDRLAKPVYASVTVNVPSQAWLTTIGDVETLKTLPIKLGPPVILGPGSFMAVGSGQGLIYIVSKSQSLVSIAWDHAPTH